MERISEEHFGRASLREEHFHRYRIASLVSSGRVVDCACGVGYGAELLRGNPAVTSYLGIDPSEESVAFANTTYARAGTAFETGTIENNRCGPGTVDTFVMLETLEHTQDPAECLRNIRLRLAENGLLIGSVPSAHYEGVCERVYGPNPFHLQRFTQEELSRHLGVHFESMRFFAAEFVLGTLLRPLDGSAGVGAEMEHPVSPQGEVMGSIMFLAGPAKRVQQAMKVLKKPFRFYPGLAKAKLDEEEVEAVRRVLRQTETLATARWEIMQDMDAMIRDRDKALTSLNAMVGDRDTAITSLNAMVGDRDTAITSLNAVVADLRAVAASQENKVQHLEGMLSDREDLLDFKRSLICQQLDMTGSIIRRMGHRAALKALRTVEQDHVPFRDLAFSLYLSCARLMDRVRDGKIGDLFFFSREGYFLKQMFDTLRTLTPDCPAVRTHYLQVSRRSTFLISLGPLESESFEVLFRQYRRISLHDFLSSLALDDHSAVIAADMGIAQDEVHKVRDDLPTDAVFASLMASEVFRTLYRDEKEKRSAAFKSYIEGLVGGQLPQALHVVDVGWKGSIQDNLHRWLAATQGAAASVDGYYIGLIAAGAASASNRKAGLLFSSLDGMTPGFRIFDENRSLFEVLLPAPHGSALSYACDGNGIVQVLQGDFAERQVIEAHILPVARAICQSFNRIASLFASAPLAAGPLFRLVQRRHRRMVYHPTAAEIAWMESITHVENFGVFGESRFGDDAAAPPLADRARFTWKVIRRRSFADLGFWPYLTLLQKALPGATLAYRLVRAVQEPGR